MKRLVLAGTHSGVGKTTIAMGLMAAFARRGLKVQAYKAGPDYLDPTYHRMATGSPSRNLDGWMTGRAGVEESFSRGTGELAIIEGVMGLFDGASARSEAGSTAELAKWLGAPVVLVVDAGGMARSAAAVVEGFRRFDPDLTILGVVFNRLGSQAHLKLLAEALDDRGIPVLGGLLKRDDLALPSRHLGLVTADDRVVPQEKIQAIADWVEAGVDLDRLERSAGGDPVPPRLASTVPKRCRIAYAWDEAFHFYYPENLERLTEAGAELVAFSPLHDRCLPEADGLYFGGGYPELFAERLSGNVEMRAAIKRFGGPVYGECGGLMYLSEAIVTQDGTFPMVGSLPGKAMMGSKLKALGYAEVTLAEDDWWGPAGTRFRGHQFRYSDLVDVPESVRQVYRIAKRRAEPFSEGYRQGNVLGTYIHAHWGSNPELPRRLVQACSR